MEAAFEQNRIFQRMGKLEEALNKWGATERNIKEYKNLTKEAINIREKIERKIRKLRRVEVAFEQNRIFQRMEKLEVALNKWGATKKISKNMRT